MSAQATATPKKPALNLVPNSKIRVHSAGDRDTALVSSGIFRGLVSVGGDNSLALELAEEPDRGRIRLIPLNAVFAIDILEAAKAEEEHRADASVSQGYFR
ncbi:MAG: hypothetical protein WCA77_02895 [Thermoplasmata archaeon]